MQIEPRANVSVLRAGLAPIIAVLAALVLCSVLIVWAGAPVLES
jgi:general nucleoside transport system permease protein